MPGSCVTVDMGFGSVDTAHTHISLRMCLDLLLPPGWKQKCVGFHGTFFCPLYSPADVGLLWNQHSQKGLRLVLKRLASISLVPQISSDF